MLKYMITGWSKRLGLWREEYIEAKNRQQAILRYKANHPSTIKVKAYALATASNAARQNVRGGE